ncbi:MAG: SGNH/GDSL hydrolase family protein [Candidatus Binatia bacterium]
MQPPLPPALGPWKTLIFTLIPVVVLLLGFEVAIRMRGADRHCHGSYESSLLWTCDPILSFQVRKGMTPLNEVGFRSPEFTTKRAGVFRILALGDSTTFGLIDEGEFKYIETPYPQRLQEILDHRAGPAKFEVLNAGVPGYNSFMGVMLLRQKLRGLQPDVITVRYGWNDHLMSMGGEAGNAYRELDNPFLLAIEDVLLQTATYRYLRRLGRELEARRSPERKPTVADIPREWKPNVPLGQYKKNLRRIVKLGREQGATVWLLTTPHAFLTDENRGQYDKFPDTMSAKLAIAFSAIPTFERMIEIHDQYAEATREVARQTGATLIDMEAAYAAHASEHLYSSSDVVHPTQLGHDLEAEMLHRQLAAEGIAPEL